MVEDNLLVSKTISDSLVLKTWRLSQESLLTFGHLYREAVVTYMEIERPLVANIVNSRKKT
mgnify:CR=1 FL=1